MIREAGQGNRREPSPVGTRRPTESRSAPLDGFGHRGQHTESCLCCGSVGMKRRTRIQCNDSQKAVMWDRWQKGESLHQIAALDRHPHPYAAPSGRHSAGSSSSVVTNLELGRARRCITDSSIGLPRLVWPCARMSTHLHLMLQKKSAVGRRHPWPSISMASQSPSYLHASSGALGVFLQVSLPRGLARPGSLILPFRAASHVV